MAKKKTKRKPQTKAKKEEFYVGVSNANSVHLSLLESKKEILQSMKIFQEMKQIRQQKIEEKQMLRKNVRLIQVQLGKIKRAMPHINLPAEEEKPAPAPIQQPVEQKKEEPKPAPPPAHPKTELDRIESQLQEIESKLSGLQ